MAVAALDRADEAMAEYAAVCESAEREAHETQRAALVTEYDRAWEANARASDEVVRARATTNAADAIAADRDLVRLARMPDGAIAMAEAVNSANSARARLSAANAKSEAAYRRFYAADRALKAFDAAHPAQA